jgi:hypothetical protein
MASFFDDPATYQGATGGLLDQLLASVAATPTPSAGFPAAAGAQASPLDNAQWPAGPNGAPSQAPIVASDDDEAPAAPAGAQASPIAVGGYQMPRVGPAAAFMPPAINPATGATVQQPAAAPAPTPSFLDTARDHLNASSLSMGHGGGLIGGLTALVTGQRHDPQAEAMQQTRAALLATGRFSPQEALIATIDPEARKVLIAQKFGPHNAENLGQGYIRDPVSGNVTRAYTPEQNDSFSTVQVAEDGLGKKTFMKLNKATGDMTPIAAAPGADANSTGLGDMSKTGGAYLATIPPQQAGIVKAMVEGRQAPPSSYALSKPYWQSMMQAAQAYDPTFDSTNWSGRVAGVKDFSAGKSSEMVRSANQTLQHVNALIDSADALHNGNYPSANWVGNKFNEATGGGEPGAFVTNAHAVADEMGKVFKGANLSDSEIHAWADALSPNMSPAQQRAQIGKMTELLHGALDALDEKRVSSIGQVAADKASPIIKPAGQAVLQRIDQWLKAGNGAPGAAGGTAPTGVKWSVVQ